MEQFKAFCKKALHPHWVLIVILSTLCGAGLIWVFATGREHTLPAYLLYPLSAYALTVLGIWAIPKNIQAAKRYEHAANAQSPKEKQMDFRKSLKQGMAVNLIWGLIQMALGYFDSSFWTGSQGLYTLIMAAIHLVLLSYNRKLEAAQDPDLQWRLGWRGFGACGNWLLILHLTMTGQIFLMIWKGETEYSGEILVIGVAAYTFYKLTMAIIRVMQYKKNATPLWGAAQNIDLSEAILNLYILQASLLAVFGTQEQAGFRFLMNTIVGVAVCVMTVGGAIGMIFHSKKRLAEGVQGNEREPIL